MGTEECEDASSCWNGARYFRYVTGVDPDIDSVDSYPNSLDPEKMRAWGNGIYHIVQSNSFESHYFTLILFENDLSLYQTYGGINRITILMFNKDDWIEHYIKSTEGDVNSYNYCFSLCVDHDITDYIGDYLKV